MRELLKKTSGKQGKIAYLQGKVVFLYKYIHTFVYLHGSRKSLPFFLLFSFFKITINNIWFHYIFLNKIVNFSSYSFPTTLASLVPFHPLTHIHTPSLPSIHFCYFVYSILPPHLISPSFLVSYPIFIITPSYKQIDIILSSLLHFPENLIFLYS